MAAGSIVDVIGQTPSVWLDRLVAARGLKGRILAKLDYLNPGFSKKDRAAKGIIEAAEAEATLKPGQTVVELTSGNMGTGLAIVCGIKGYPFVAVMSRGNSVERARMMLALGAEVILVDQAQGSSPGQVSGADLALVEAEAARVTRARRAFRADQFHHAGNARAHYETTAPELWADSDGSLTAFADFAGSGGTFGGTVKGLKEKNPNLCGYLVEPEGAAVLAGNPAHTPGHPIQGGGYAMPDLDFLRDVQTDGYLTVSGDEARATVRALAQEEGIFAGFSTGANVAAALRLLQGPESGGVIGVIACDSGLKYLSTDLWA
ncbi:cysteine synthase [Phaeobacter gallaeciensis]|uniref:Cysteine synthase n=2 Tax=Roseobacteraceae TaxID=2854170 RepID=A0A366XAL3_9RHOB|nr:MULTISPECIES: cysteine synthase family protein [Roseobacteraceae]MBT3141973.1 cysteine synthase family protein [Falsiruegeria litorea]MBT8168680.1 cysteine synthase family protein [Falsiruegeria litorea]RBW60053.1 cysteine synthase [Phaeobacter gallaeciensis]